MKWTHTKKVTPGCEDDAGHGLFASRRFKQGKKIGVYIGKKRRFHADQKTN